MSEKSTTDRRSFLKLAGFGAAGAVATVAGTEAQASVEVKTNSSARYAETDHVKKVYELSRF